MIGKLLRRGRRALSPRLVMLGSFASLSLIYYGFGLVAGWLLVPGEFGLLAFTQTILLIGGLVLNSGFPWTLTAALVGRTASIVDDAGAKLGRYVESQFPDGVRVERAILSSEEFH